MPDTNDLKYSWNLSDIFKNTTEFENTKKETLNLLEKIQKFQGILCDSSDNLYKCYSLDEKALQNLKSYMHMEC